MHKVSLHIFLGKCFYHFIPLIAGMLFSLSTKAQDFDYSFTKDSVAWQELNEQTILNTNNSAWNFSYKIPFGFSFEFLGRNFDSLTIETNGYVIFDEDRNYALTAFSGFNDCVDSTGNHSVLGYALSGTIGSRILKIQFKNTSSIYAAPRLLSYQIWFCESGNKVEIRTGSQRFNFSDPHDEIVSVLESLGSFQDVEPVSIESIHIDKTPAFKIGLLNMNMDTPLYGYFISGNPSSPQGHQVNNESTVLPGLTSMPNKGMKYTFQPVSN